jgi:hypothetical protein
MNWHGSRRGRNPWGRGDRMTTSTGPGWYPDPWNVAPQRWWDGMQWTAFVGPVPPPGGLSPTELLAAHRGEERMIKWARFAICAWSVFVVTELTVFTAVAGRIRRNFDRIFHELDAARPGQRPPQPFGGLCANLDRLNLSELLLLGAGIILLVWQYNAARVAHGLGYPTRTSPAFGVGSWFILISNPW